MTRAFVPTSGSDRPAGLEAHRVDCGEIGFFGPDDVFAFVSLLADEVDGVLKEANTPSA